MTSVDSFCNVLWRELRRIVRHPIYWMILVVLPVVSFLLFGAMFSRGVARDIPIAVVDGDHTPLSRQLTDMISATPAALVRYGIGSTDEGERMIRRGEISAFVVIPSGFAADLAAPRKTSVEAFISAANVTVNGLLARDIQTVVQTFGAGIELRRMVAHGTSRAEAMTEIMPIRFDEHILFNPWLNYGYYLAPSFSVMMLLVFIICSTTWAVGSELRRRTAGEWLAMAGGNIAVALAGKLLPSLVAMSASALAMFTILTHVVDVPVNGSVGLLLVATLLFILSYQMIAVAVVAMVANMRLALSLSGGYAVLAFTFSGLTFPVMAMWEPMQWFSRLFPFTYYSDVMVDQMLRGAPVRYSLVNVAIMSLFAVVPLLTLPRLKRVCSDRAFWGKSYRMKKEKGKMKNYTWPQDLSEVVMHEFRAVFRDSGAMLLLVFALLIYATIYSLAYGAEVVHNVPIGVIDMSRTPMSRTLADKFDAGANTYVAYTPTDMTEAERLFFKRRIYGIVYIPADFERRLLGGGQATVAIYCDASYFLMYRQVFQELVASIQTAGARVEFGRLLAQGAEIPEIRSAVQPVSYASHNLFNTSLGYGSFVIPPILMVIIQQTLLVGIGIVGGTWRERHLYRRLMSRNGKMISPLTVLVGRMSVYGAVYAVTTSYILTVHYRLFGYPMNGRGWDVALFVGLYILCCTAFALAVSTLFRRRESSLLLLLWSSIPLLMLSGVSFPREGIPEWLNALARLFPSTHGVEGFVRIQTMGATLSDVAPQIGWLAALMLLFALVFILQIRRLWRRSVSGVQADVPSGTFPDPSDGRPCPRSR